MDVKAFANMEIQAVSEQVAAVVETKESKELRFIENKFNSMDLEYFKKYTNKIQFSYDQYTKNNTAETEYLYEKSYLEFLIEEIKYEGYQRILLQPNKIEEIKLEVKKQIEDLQNERKILQVVVVGMQEKMEG
jgi:hypothetical protein